MNLKVVVEETESEEQPRYKLVPLPDFTSKYVKLMEERAAEETRKEIEKKEQERAERIAVSDLISNFTWTEN